MLLKKAAVKALLADYITNRKKGTLYKTFWGRFFGYSREQKIAAAEALQTQLAKKGDIFKPGILASHKGALSSGDLGKICNQTRFVTH